MSGLMLYYFCNCIWVHYHVLCVMCVRFDFVFYDYAVLLLRVGWLSSTVVERRCLAGKLSLYCARLAADG